MPTTTTTTTRQQRAAEMASEMRADELEREWRARMERTDLTLSDSIQRTVASITTLENVVAGHTIQLHSLQGAPAERRATTLTTTAVWQVALAAGSVLVATLACIVGPLVGAGLAYVVQHLH